ncbi:GGDEF domain-containing protein [Gigaspora margarita]|uniref:GGDEF domain-containing protein n=1 Tax=Gigaspora margarita TaxID=4874 RepID=A0A8H3XJY9_GIGMA|nr:GGDEF domain-containing protein [Gigaspora margarita]
MEFFSQNMDWFLNNIQYIFRKEFFNYSEFQNVETISDRLSVAYLESMEPNKSHVVLKYLKINNKAEYYKKFDREINNLKKIKANENVIGFVGITQDPSKKFHSMVLQYCFNKTLREHLINEEGFSKDWQHKIKMAKEIANGLKYIHMANIVHCNLSSKTIMNHNGKLMIIGFSSSISLDNDDKIKIASEITGENVAYVDPKCFDPNCNFDKSSDIYSLGVILWEISSSKPPFNNKKLDLNNLKISIINGERENPINSTPIDYKELYCDAWNNNPKKKRPSIEEVVNRLEDIEFDDVYHDHDYIPEIFSEKKNISVSKKDACLKVIEGRPQNQYFFIPIGEVSIGRNNSNYIIIKDQNVARKHAIIKSEQGKVDIIDFGSDLGIFVNGERLKFRTFYTLKRDDKIKMGRCTLQYLPAGEYENCIDIPLQIYNKDYLLKSLKNEFENATKNKKNLSLLFFDLDHFKRINDENNHEAGDYVLKELAKLIQNTLVRDEDIFARFGGDEFTITLRDTDLKSASEMAEKIRASIEAHQFTYNEKRLLVTLSIGVSGMNSSVETYEILLKHADEASKKAKDYGKNRVVIWENVQKSIQKSTSKNTLYSTPSESESESNILDFGSDVQNIKPYLSPKINAGTISVNEKIKVRVKIDGAEYVWANLNKSDNLNKVRTTLLESYTTVNITNCINFIKDEALIDIDHENEYTLEEILNGNIIYLKENPRPSWRELERKFKLGYGRKYEENVDDVADKKSYNIKRCDFKVFDETYTDMKEISSNDEFVRNKDLFLKSPKLSFSIESENTPQNHSEASSNVALKYFRKAVITIKKDNLQPTKEFEEAVQKAVESQSLNNVKEIIEKFGQFIPTIVLFGGRHHYNEITHTTVSSGNYLKAFSASFNVYGQGLSAQYKSGTANKSGSIIKHQDFLILGGDKIKAYQGKEEEWITSLQDFKYWVPIEFRDPISIFECLDEKLKSQIREINGKTIIYSNVQDYDDVEISNFDSYRDTLVKNSDIDIEKMFSNPDMDPQVFATVLGTDDKVFTCMLYIDDQDSKVPKIVINCIQSNCDGQKKFHVKIGWMVVGYNLNFIPARNRLYSTKKVINSEQCNENYVLKTSEDNYLAYGTPVVYELNDCSVIGHHFSRCGKKSHMCLYRYNLNEKKYFKLLNCEFNILSFINVPITKIFKYVEIKRKPPEGNETLTKYKLSENNESKNAENRLPKFISLYTHITKECQQCYPEFFCGNFENFVLERPEYTNTLIEEPFFAAVFDPDAKDGKCFLLRN